MKPFVALSAIAVAVVAAVGTIAFYTADTQTRKCGPVPGALAAFKPAESRAKVAEISFIDETGVSRGLADHRGRGLVVNFWATWCLPCVREMPALDRLNAALSSDGIDVLTISGDRGGASVVEGFYRKHGIDNLSVLVDSGLAGARRLGITGLPTTIVIDREGYEIGRMAGAAEWDAADAVSFIRSCIDGDGG